VTLFLTVVHVMVCVLMIVLVLIQRGKGAEIGAVFGGGASTTVFGSRGAGNFLTKMTTGGAIVFMVTSLSLSYLANTRSTRSIFEESEPPAAESTTPETSSPFQEVAPPEPAEAPAAPEAAGAAAPATEGAGETTP
jgi:preprotein translocase subunit SecG